MKLVSARLRQQIIERARRYCEYCRSPMRYSVDAFSVEHIVPRSRGGKTRAENLALSCQGCNNYKYNKIDGYDPVTEKAVSLFNPRQQKWKDHFVWSADSTIIVGITPTGRATVLELQL